jgi:hypothetical protein
MRVYKVSWLIEYSIESPNMKTSTNVAAIGHSVSRRMFIAASAALAASKLTKGNQVAVPATSIERVRNTVAFGVDWSSIRGFNYLPSYGRTNLDAWYNFDAGRITAELALGKLYFPHIDAIRFYIPFDAFVQREDEFKRDLESYIRAVHTIGCRAIPILFNRWRGIPNYGSIDLDQLIPGSFAYANFEKQVDSYIAATVGGHRADERVLAWDLCNEPFSTQSALGKDDPTPKVFSDAETRWLQSMHRRVKALTPVQPVTVAAFLSYPLEKFAPFSDVLSIHSYYDLGGPASEAAYEQSLNLYVSYANRVGKPLLASECCWGRENDAEHVQIINFTSEQLSRRGIGFMPDGLSHSLATDEHRRLFGPTDVEMMAFIEADGRLRAGHEVFNKY